MNAGISRLPVGERFKSSKLYTDEISDLGRKMDVGNRKLDAAIDVLRDIKTDTSVLSSFVAEQREHNEGQREPKPLDERAQPTP
ncbi:MAG: hypothetical protein OI715_00670 (plasmid) [Candidatus Methanoperedens sp.]|nr:MAG: hypothetical protein OI715_00670 [Candidatus Methanoperedens sp.]